MAGNSTSSVIAGITANSLVTVVKFIGFAVTGSAALLSEAIHSFADTTNQALLLVGLKRSERPADEKHPYGYGRDRFFWGLVSALGIFFLGAGVTIYHGIEGLIHPHAVNHTWVTWAVLAFALVVEAWALWVAVRGVQKDAKAAGMSAMRFAKEGQDPTLIAVLLEDSAAVLGVIVAAICIMMTQLTGNPMWDALASLLVGILLALVAIFLIAANRKFLLTKAVDDEVEAKVREVIAGHGTVEDISAFKGVVTSIGSYRIAADVDFDGRKLASKLLEGKDLGEVRSMMATDEGLEAYLGEFAENVIEQVGDEIDELEAKIKEAVPATSHVDLEQD